MKILIESVTNRLVELSAMDLQEPIIGLEGRTELSCIIVLDNGKNASVKFTARTEEVEKMNMKQMTDYIYQIFYFKGPDKE